MKKSYCIIIFFLSSLMLYGQKVKIGDCVPINLAYHDWREDFNNMYWLYIWDVSASTFEKEFCLIEKMYVESGETVYDAINVLKLKDENALVFVNRNNDIFMILGNGIHGKLYSGSIINFSTNFVEFQKGNRYCDSYSIVYSTPSHLSKNKTGNCYYYAEFDESGRILCFSNNGFTSSEIINSNRQISPEDPWMVSYNSNGDVCRVRNYNVDITLQWEYKDNYIQFQRVDETKNKDVPDYDRHRIRYSDLDNKGRWTKEIIYDYDVIKDKMVPACVIKRTFLSADQFDLYKLCGFNPDVVANYTKETEPQKNEPTTDEKNTQISEVMPRFNGGDASDFALWVAKHLQYPEIARENGDQGRVMVEFVVDTTGNVKDVKVLKGVSPALDKEALRVVSSSPQWEPGRNNEGPTDVTLSVPVIFSLR